MQRYILARIAQGFLTLWALSFIVFISAHLTGDPALILLPPEAANPEDYELMKKKLVSRRRDTEDRRIVTTRITKNGEKLLEEIDDQFSQMESEPLGHMKKKELDQLIDLLERVREQGS